MSGAPTGEVRLCLAGDQSPVHATDVGFVKHGQAVCGEQASAQVDHGTAGLDPLPGARQHACPENEHLPSTQTEAGPLNQFLEEW